MGTKRDQLESKFEHDLMKDLEDLLPGCYIFKLGYDGIPDRLILFRNTWLTLEVKRSATARKQPNQDWHVRVMNDMSYSAFVFPENREEIIDEICEVFGVGGAARHS